MELIEILEALNETHGPSGDEGGVRAKIEELAGQHRLHRHPH